MQVKVGLTNPAEPANLIPRRRDIILCPPLANFKCEISLVSRTLLMSMIYALPFF